MKWFGVLLVALAGCGLGLYYARRLYRRVTLLEQAVRLVDALEQRMAYSSRPLSALCRELAGSPAARSWTLLTDTQSGLDKGEVFAAALTAAAERQQTVLTPEDRQLLAEFAAGCGRSGLRQQQAHFAAYRERLERCCREAREQVQRRGPVYQMMGVAGGVCLALLLL